MSSSKGGHRRLRGAVQGPSRWCRSSLSRGLLELACQAPGRAMHSKRAAGPLGAQWEAAVRPCGPAKVPDSAAFPPCSCHAMDTHFTTAPPERNLPMMMGLLGVWNANFLNLKTRAVFPYCEALWRLPSHIQQVVEYTRAGRIGLQAGGMWLQALT